jgi:hypothetical protein
MVREFSKGAPASAAELLRCQGTVPFVILVPTGWTVDSTGLQPVRVILYEPSAAKGFRANINVIVDSIGPTTAEEYLALTRLQVAQMSGRPRLHVDQPDQVKDRWLLEWHARMGAMHIKVRQLIVFRRGSALVVSATALYDRFSEYRPAFEAALDSFRVSEEAGVGNAPA